MWIELVEQHIARLGGSQVGGIFPPSTIELENAAFKKKYVIERSIGYVTQHKKKISRNYYCIMSSGISWLTVV